MYIQSSGVKKNGLLIDGEGRAHTISSTQAEDRNINTNTGKVWSVNFEGISANAGTDFYLIHNTGSTNLHITDIRIIANDATTTVWVKKVTGTVGGNTTITDVTSRNTGSAVLMTANNDSATAATGLTGLTDVGKLFPIQAEASKMAHLRTSSNIIISPGGKIALECVTANATNGITGTVSVVEVDIL